MEIGEINIHQVRIPFTGDFSHSQTPGKEAANVIVKVAEKNGSFCGFGEGAPRHFVTGETQESVRENLIHFISLKSFPWRLNGPDQIRRFVDDLPEDKENLAAVCAIETTLLDALGKDENRPLITYFDQGHRTEQVVYGAGVPLTSRERVQELCTLIKGLGISRVKLKMGMDYAQNRDAFEALEAVFTHGCDLKIDVNGAWDYKTALAHLPLILRHNVRVVEEPLSPEDPDIERLAGAYGSKGVILMADESACTVKEIEKIVREGYFGMVNIRLSKCGGFRRSLRAIEILRRSPISFQIGAQLGESGILSAAGRALSILCGKDALYHDGSYDRFLLKRNITTEHISFGFGGAAFPLSGPGLGVRVNEENLAQFTTRLDRLCN